MKILLMIKITNKEDDSKIGFPYHLQKSFESNVIPHKNDIIEDCTWEEPQHKIKEIIINYEDDICCIELEEMVADDSQEAQSYYKEGLSNRWI
ncbi:MAG: hypothetical protein P4L45_09855 [Ignavibacteriaceae bacterium]|nr:hypothetical protein [Ignavibacteriaceae bacterium]